MKFQETALEGAYIIELDRMNDERGFFARTWCKNEFASQGLNTNFLQANMSWNNKKGTLRGMHYQIHPYEETKLVRCTKGAIYDVIIDLRPESGSYKQWVGVELTSDNYRLLYVPEKFAHGLITLEDNTEVSYQVSQFYTPGSERGARYNDSAFGIDWPLDVQVISEKDRNWPDYTL